MSAADVNNPTGSNGLFAVDKRGCRGRWLDPTSFEELASIELPARPHEVAISADHQTAYVSVYGSGVYGNNPQPAQEIVVLDLAERRSVKVLSVAPYLAPHGLVLDREGLLYASCDASGVVAVLNPTSGEVLGRIDVGTKGNHMITMLPDGSKLSLRGGDRRPGAAGHSVRERRLAEARNI